MTLYLLIINIIFFPFILLCCKKISSNCYITTFILQLLMIATMFFFKSWLNEQWLLTPKLPHTLIPRTSHHLFPPLPEREPEKTQRRFQFWAIAVFIWVVHKGVGTAVIMLHFFFLGDFVTNEY